MLKIGEERNSVYGIRKMISRAVRTVKGCLRDETSSQETVKSKGLKKKACEMKREKRTLRHYRITLVLLGEGCEIMRGEKSPEKRSCSHREWLDGENKRKKEKGISQWKWKRERT